MMGRAPAKVAMRDGFSMTVAPDEIAAFAAALSKTIDADR